MLGNAVSGYWILGDAPSDIGATYLGGYAVKVVKGGGIAGGTALLNTVASIATLVGIVVGGNSGNKAILLKPVSGGIVVGGDLADIGIMSITSKVEFRMRNVTVQITINSDPLEVV